MQQQTMTCLFTQTYTLQEHFILQEDQQHGGTVLLGALHISGLTSYLTYQSQTLSMATPIQLLRSP